MQILLALLGIAIVLLLLGMTLFLPWPILVLILFVGGGWLVVAGLCRSAARRPIDRDPRGPS